MSSLRYELPRCHSTALTVTNSSFAISRLVRPSAASSATRRSLGVSSPPARRTAARPPARWSSSRAARAAQRPDRLGDADGLAQDVARLGGAADAPDRPAELDKRVCQLDPRAALREQSAAERSPSSTGTALEQRRRAARDADRARRAEPLGQRDLLGDQLPRLLLVAESQRGEPGLGAPVEHRRIAHENRLGPLAAGALLVQCPLPVASRGGQTPGASCCQAAKMPVGGARAAPSRAPPRPRRTDRSRSVRAPGSRPRRGGTSAGRWRRSRPRSPRPRRRRGSSRSTVAGERAAAGRGEPRQRTDAPSLLACAASTASASAYRSP